MVEKMDWKMSKRKDRTIEIYEAPFGKFEMDIVPELRSEDIGNNDRAFVVTKSGNRYMIRHSKSRGESLVIYNERSKSGFSAGGAYSFMVRNEDGEKGPIARINSPLNILVISGKDGDDTFEWKSTTVNRIEIRRGIEAAIRKIASSRGESSDSQSVFGGIARAFGSIGDARSDSEEEIDPLDPKYRR